jgi:hypothetical protein
LRTGSIAEWAIVHSLSHESFAVATPALVLSRALEVDG